MNMIRLAACAIGALTLVACQTPQSSDLQTLGHQVNDTGAGFYYPEPESTDTFTSSFEKRPIDQEFGRQYFVDSINMALSSSNRNVPVILQSVGEDQTSLVFTLLNTPAEPTPYLAKALLARMTSTIRFEPAIAAYGLSEEIEVYDLAAILGFERIVVTDGREFAHEILLEAKPAENTDLSGFSNFGPFAGWQSH